MTVVLSLLGAGAAAFVTGVLTYVVTAWKVRRDLQVEYDRDLRGKRLAAYAELWRLTQTFSIYSPSSVSGARCTRLSQSLTDWYFQRGGMYLSTTARNRYFDLMNELTRVRATTLLGGVAVRRLQGLSSDLRTQITRDVGTREPPLYRRGAADEGDRRPTPGADVRAELRDRPSH